MRRHTQTHPLKHTHTFTDSVQVVCVSWIPERSRTSCLVVRVVFPQREDVLPLSAISARPHTHTPETNHFAYKTTRRLQHFMPAALLFGKCFLLMCEILTVNNKYFMFSATLTSAVLSQLSSSESFTGTVDFLMNEIIDKSGTVSFLCLSDLIDLSVPAGVDRQKNYDCRHRPEVF